MGNTLLFFVLPYCNLLFVVSVEASWARMCEHLYKQVSSKVSRQYRLLSSW